MVNPICLLAIKIGGKENVVAACCFFNVMRKNMPPCGHTRTSNSPEFWHTWAIPRCWFKCPCFSIRFRFFWASSQLKLVKIIKQWDHLEPPFVICATSHGLRKIPCKNKTAGQTSIRLYCKKNKASNCSFTISHQDFTLFMIGSPHSVFNWVTVWFMLYCYRYDISIDHSSLDL